MEGRCEGKKRSGQTKVENKVAKSGRHDCGIKRMRNRDALKLMFEQKFGQ